MSLVRQNVQPGTTASLRIQVDTASVSEENGKAGAFVLREAILSSADGTVVDLVATASWVAPAMVERAYFITGDATAEVSGAPAYSAAAGPSSENIYIVTVDDSSDFEVGDFVRAQAQPSGQGQVYKVLAIPSGTLMHLHCKSGGCDIVDGDTVEEVQPLGTYVGSFDFPVSTYLDAGNSTAELRLIITTVATGADPKFASSSELTWTLGLELDIGSRAYRAG